MDLIDRSQSRGKTPRDPLVPDTAVMFGARAVDPILAAVMCDRTTDRTYDRNRFDQNRIPPSCQQGAVHIWVPAQGRDDDRKVLSANNATHLPPNNRCTSQPSSPAAASGRVEFEARVGAGRYPPAGGIGASDAGAGGAFGAVICDAVA